MLIVIFGIYCAVATLVALGLLRGGSCREAREQARPRALPDAGGLPLLPGERPPVVPRLRAGFGTGG